MRNLILLAVLLTAKLSATLTVTELAFGQVISGSWSSGSVSVSAGDGLVLMMTGDDRPVTVTSVSGGGVTWAKAVGAVATTNSEIWYGMNSTGGTVTITADFNDPDPFAHLNLTKITNMATASALDQSGSSSATCSTATTASITTTDTSEVIFAVVSGSTNNPPGNGFTALSSDLTTEANFAYLITSSAGAYSTSWSENCANDSIQIASFKEEGGSPPPNPHHPRKAVVM